jgi:dihydrofolate reductase
MTPRRLSILAAMARTRVIGKDNTLPWRLSPDLKRFKALTMGHPIIMGRKTFESIGKPLPGRTSIVVTHQSGYEAQGAAVVHSIATALRECYKNADTTETFIIGGAEIFRQTLPVCDRIYLTEIQADYEGDVLFPEFDQAEWMETSREKHRMDEDGLEYHFVVLDRRTDLGSR